MAATITTDTMSLLNRVALIGSYATAEEAEAAQANEPVYMWVDDIAYVCATAADAAQMLVDNGMNPKRAAAVVRLRCGNFEHRGRVVTVVTTTWSRIKQMRFALVSPIAADREAALAFRESAEGAAIWNLAQR